MCTRRKKQAKWGKADLIKPEDVGRVASYAAAAELFDFKLLYLEAGSGASTPVSPDLISAARSSTDIPIVVGGGIRDGAAARTAVEGRCRLDRNRYTGRGVRRRGRAPGSAIRTHNIHAIY
jgi:heptaprenylglyceryl phosphate synthase